MSASRVRWAVLATVVALAGVTGILVATATVPDSSAGESVVTITRTVTAGAPPETSTGPQEPPSTDAPPATDTSPPTAEPTDEPDSPNGRAPTNVPMTKLEPGQTPPQFVIFSFDGAGSTAKMREFLDAADDSNARFVAFLSGTYLIEDAARNAYQAPGANRGASDVGFGGSAAQVIDRIEHLNELLAAGHELGTHYNGHFCRLGLNWSTSEWDRELDQFFTFLTDWKTINGATAAPELLAGRGDIQGGRTPCLNHQWDQIVPAWKSHGMTYDSSEPAPRNGIYWPQRRDGIWEFYMPYVYSPGFGGMVTAMDYNFWVKYNQATENPSSAPELTRIVLDTYHFMYEQAYSGNRAPVLIANHFNDWNGNSFNPAAEQFMREACTQPDTYCATYQDVIAWMELQDPAVLDELLNAYPVAYEPARPA